MNTNTIQHYLSADGIRLTVADTSNVSLEAEAIHHLPPASARILAKAMTGAAILINDFKNHEALWARSTSMPMTGALSAVSWTIRKPEKACLVTMCMRLRWQQRRDSSS